MKISLIVAALCYVEVLAADGSPFIEYGLVPDVIDAPPEDGLEVDFGSGLRVAHGTELTPAQVRERPSLSWPAGRGSLYTVFMVDPDAPARRNATMREYLHFMVGNVPDNDVSRGTTLAPYMGSAPPKDSGLHRYILLVYKQTGYIEASAILNRAKFSVRKYASEKQLGEPVAGNFFVARYENAGNRSAVESAMYVTCLAFVGLYLSWNW